MRKNLLFFLMAILIGKAATASEIFDDFISARAMGMGGAFSAVVDDHTALYFNPAALDKIHGLHLTVLSPQIGTDTENAYNTLSSVQGSNYSSVIHQFFGQQVWVGVSDDVSVSMHDFALAGYDFTNISFDLHNPAYPNVSIHATNDIGLVGGFAASLLDNNALRAGFAVKRITRYGGEVPFGPSIVATLSNSQLTNMINNYGTGYGLDAGLLMELPAPSHPTFAAVWHDIGQTAFTLAGGTQAPPPLDNDPVLGFSMEFKGAGFTLRPALDYSHINLDQTEELGKLVHMGAELLFPGGLAIRGGANQGYYTAGAGLNLGFLQIDAATYGVELDTYPGQMEDRRYILQFTVDLDFDPNFDFIHGHGSGTGGGGAVSPSYERR